MEQKQQNTKSEVSKVNAKLQGGLCVFLGLFGLLAVFVNLESKQWLMAALNCLLVIGAFSLGMWLLKKNWK
jgi:hypothetical protein